MAKQCTKLVMCTELAWKITKILRTKKCAITTQKSVFSFRDRTFFWFREQCVKIWCLGLRFKELTLVWKWSCARSFQRLFGTMRPQPQPPGLPLTWGRGNRGLYLPRQGLALWAWCRLLGLPLLWRQSLWGSSALEEGREGCIVLTCVLCLYVRPQLAVMVCVCVCGDTFRAVVVLIQLSVFGLLLPSNQVVCLVPVGWDRRWPSHHQLGRCVGVGSHILWHGGSCV